MREHKQTLDTSPPERIVRRTTAPQPLAGRDAGYLNYTACLLPETVLKDELR